MFKYANTRQVSSPSRALLRILVFGPVAPLVKKYEFLENLAFNLQAVDLYTTEIGRKSAAKFL